MAADNQSSFRSIFKAISLFGGVTGLSDTDTDY